MEKKCPDRNKQREKSIDIWYSNHCNKFFEKIEQKLKSGSFISHLNIRTSLTVPKLYLHDGTLQYFFLISLFIYEFFVTKNH